ncbi:hypothetical protein [Bradyrhizobium sp. DOA9]
MKCEIGYVVSIGAFLQRYYIYALIFMQRPPRRNEVQGARPRCAERQRS